MEKHVYKTETICFSGKEYGPMSGLNSYDFGARWQMPDLTRFGQMDPLAESHLGSRD